MNALYIKKHWLHEMQTIVSAGDMCQALVIHALGSFIQLFDSVLEIKVLHEPRSSVLNLKVLSYVEMFFGVFEGSILEI